METRLTDPAGTGDRTRLPRTAAIVLGVAALTVAVYLPVLANGFVAWDDGVYALHPALGSLDRGLLRFAFGFDTPNWHPLTWLVHGLERTLWGVRPGPQHAASVLLHAADAALVFLVVRALARARAAAPGGADPGARAELAAGVASVLFAIHPTHVESVAWASGQKDLLCTLFVLLATRAYLRHAVARVAGAGAPGWAASRAWLASVGWFALALLAKPSAVTFPAVLLALDLAILGRRGEGIARLALEKAPHAALSLAVAAVTYGAHDAMGDLTGLDAVGVPARLVVAASSAMAYLGHLAWPAGLLPLYPYPSAAELRAPVYAVSVVAFVAVSVACAATARRAPALAGAWAAYLALLLPVLGLVKMGFQEMADRYAYLPSVVPIALAGFAAARLVPALGGAGRRVLAGAALAAVAALCLVSSSLVRIWKDDLSLWTHEIEVAPGRSFLAYQNRGVALSAAGRLDEALADYDVALALNPRSAELHYNRANVLARMGRLDDALVHYDLAIGLAGAPNPDYLRNREAVVRWRAERTPAR